MHLGNFGNFEKKYFPKKKKIFFPKLPRCINHFFMLGRILTTMKFENMGVTYIADDEPRDE